MEKPNNMLELFQANLDAEYEVTRAFVHYAFIEYGDTLHIHFQHSQGVADWVANFMFLKRPYSHMQVPWRAHGGFLFCWEQVKPIIAAKLAEKDWKEIITVGYSHGAALAVLCHEYIWFRCEHLRDNIRGYGFGCPRVIGRFRIPKKLRCRWSNFTVIRNESDLVTHVPFKLKRFTHVKKPLRLGRRRLWGKINAHRPESYMENLIRFHNLKVYTKQENPDVNNDESDLLEF